MTETIIANLISGGVLFLVFLLIRHRQHPPDILHGELAMPDPHPDCPDCKIVRCSRCGLPVSEVDRKRLRDMGRMGTHVMPPPLR